MTESPCRKAVLISCKIASTTSSFDSPDSPSVYTSQPDYISTPVGGQTHTVAACVLAPLMDLMRQPFFSRIWVVLGLGVVHVLVDKSGLFPMVGFVGRCVGA